MASHPTPPPQTDLETMITFTFPNEAIACSTDDYDSAGTGIYFRSGGRKQRKPCLIFVDKRNHHWDLQATAKHHGFIKTSCGGRLVIARSFDMESNKFKATLKIEEKAECSQLRFGIYKGVKIVYHCELEAAYLEAKWQGKVLSEDGRKLGAWSRTEQVSGCENGDFVVGGGRGKCQCWRCACEMPCDC